MISVIFNDRRTINLRENSSKFNLFNHNIIEQLKGKKKHNSTYSEGYTPSVKELSLCCISILPDDVCRFGSLITFKDLVDDFVFVFVCFLLLTIRSIYSKFLCCGRFESDKATFRLCPLISTASSKTLYFMLKLPSVIKLVFSNCLSTFLK